MMIAQLMAQSAKDLIEKLSLDNSEARIEVQLLLQRVLGVSRAYLVAHAERKLNEFEYAQYQTLLQRRLRGEPVAYLLGEREFYGLSFEVSAATLIPRPETELLVELALERMPQRTACRVLDLGTGSGAIALSIAHARRDAELVAVDRSAAALEVARSNVRRLKLDKVRLLQSDWFAALQGECFDLIVSNPPYIAAGDAHLLRGDVRFEPPAALASGADGLEDIRRIVAQAGHHLRDHGWLLLEHGYDQAGQVRALLEQAGLSRVFSARDLAGIERVSGAAVHGRERVVIPT